MSQDNRLCGEIKEVTFRLQIDRLTDRQLEGLEISGLCAKHGAKVG